MKKGCVNRRSSRTGRVTTRRGKANRFEPHHSFLHSNSIRKAKTKKTVTKNKKFGAAQREKRKGKSEANQSNPWAKTATRFHGGWGNLHPLKIGLTGEYIGEDSKKKKGEGSESGALTKKTQNPTGPAIFKGTKEMNKQGRPTTAAGCPRKTLLAMDKGIKVEATLRSPFLQNNDKPTTKQGFRVGKKQMNETMGPGKKASDGKKKRPRLDQRPMKHQRRETDNKENAVKKGTSAPPRKGQPKSQTPPGIWVAKRQWGKPRP